MKPPHLPEPGDRFGEFLVLRQVGRGATSSVFIAESADLGRVALKVLAPHLAAEESARDMFEDEAMIGSRLSHPHVARALRSGVHLGLPFLALEYVDGPSYARCLRSVGSLDLAAGFHFMILSAAAEGLHAAHAVVDTDGSPLGLVHRDVKPENIILGTRGEVKVTDFGISQARGRIVRTGTGRTRGTLAYMAPEQVLSPKKVDRRADLWALGVVAWEALSNSRLFQGASDGDTTWNVVHAPVPPLTPAVPGVSESVVDIVRRCLERDPAARPASALAIAEVFDEAAAALGWSEPAQLTPVVDAILRTV